jgi:hypothetical protein
VLLLLRHDQSGFAEAYTADTQPRPRTWLLRQATTGVTNAMSEDQLHRSESASSHSTSLNVHNSNIQGKEDNRNPLLDFQGVSNELPGPSDMKIPPRGSDPAAPIAKTITQSSQCTAIAPSLETARGTENGHVRTLPGNTNRSRRCRELVLRLCSMDRLVRGWRCRLY